MHALPYERAVQHYVTRFDAGMSTVRIARAWQALQPLALEGDSFEAPRVPTLLVRAQGGGPDGTKADEALDAVRQALAG